MELLVLRKDMLDKRREAAVAITRAVIQACRYIVSDRAGTIDVALKYAPGIERNVLERAYAELLRIQGFGVNGGMTETNMKVAHDLALQNRQIARPIALDQWTDFRCQESALAQLGRYAG